MARIEHSRQRETVSRIQLVERYWDWEMVAPITVGGKWRQPFTWVGIREWGHLLTRVESSVTHLPVPKMVSTIHLDGRWFHPFTKTSNNGERFRTR